MLGFVNRRLSVGTRLYLVAILIIVTVTLAVIIPLQRGMDRLQTVKSEQLGQRYIGAIWQTLMTGSADTIRDHVWLNAELGTETEFNAFATATTLQTREIAVSRLIRTVSARSGLMRDSGSESFYLSEIISRRLPALVGEVDALTGAIAAPPSEERKIRIGEALARLEVDTERTRLTYDNALKPQDSDAAGTIRPSSDALLRSLDQIITAARASFDAPSPDYDDAHTGFAKALTESWDASYTALDRQLTAQIAAIWHETYRSMALVGGLAAFTLILLWVISVGLKRRLYRLNKAGKRIARGEFGVEIPYLSDRNDTGRLANTLGQIQKEMLRRDAEAERRISETEANAKRTRAEMEAAQRTAEQMVANTFGAGLKALVAEDLSFRLKADMPAAYRDLQNQFNNAIAEIERKRLARESAQRQHDADRTAAEAAHIDAVEQAHCREMDTVRAAFGEGMAALARRDLSFRMAYALPAAFEPLQEEFNLAIAHLEVAMKDITLHTSEIAQQSAGIHTAMRDVAVRSQQQAAQLEESTATINTISRSVHQSADNARAANEAALKAQKNAARGTEVARTTVSAMQSIASSSNEITQIIGVIDEIAFQTNLLALNAGVEAARAGDAGRGFAVVAQEVRALAGRSSTAAKQIRALISTSEKQVESGVKLVKESGAALDQIAADITTICNLMEAIASAQKDQASALSDVDATMGEMGKATQSNSAVTQESETASASLAAFAEELTQMVAQFQLKKEQLRRIARAA